MGTGNDEDDDDDAKLLPRISLLLIEIFTALLSAIKVRLLVDSSMVGISISVGGDIVREMYWINSRIWLRPTIRREARTIGPLTDQSTFWDIYYNSKMHIFTFSPFILKTLILL